MITRVLVAMDDSEVAERALRYALDVHTDTEIVVLNVVGGPSSMMGSATEMALADDVAAAAREDAKEVLDRANEIAAENGVTIETEVAVGQPGKRILEYAEEFDAVVLGTHSGSLVDRLLVGNVADTVFKNSPVPVTVVR